MGAFSNTWFIRGIFFYKFSLLGLLLGEEKNMERLAGCTAINGDQTAEFVT